VQEAQLADSSSTSNGRSTAYGLVDQAGAVARTTSRVQNVNLLNGMITADAVKAVSKSSWSSASNDSSSGTPGSRFENLRVAGVDMPNDVAPNTRIDLPGIGYVVLYERAVSHGPRAASAAVTMIHLHVTHANDLGLSVGSELKIAVARSGAGAY
jgi:hypothetical protein